MSSVVVMMNKRGIAIAADSALQISNIETDLKISPTANKIYTLCDNSESPISIALCDNLYFNDIPFEILIHDFQKRNPGPWDSITECCESFFNYLEQNQIEPVYAYNFFIHGVYQLNLQQFLKDFDCIKIDELENKFSDIEQSINKQDMWEGVSENTISKKTSDDLRKSLHNALKKFRSGMLLVYKERFHQLLLRAMLNKLPYEKDNPIGIGLSFIICGYGAKDYYPSLRHDYLVGIFQNKLRYTNVSDIVISCDDPSLIYSAGEGRHIIDTLVLGKSYKDFRSQQESLNICKEKINTAIAKCFEGFSNVDKLDEFQKSVDTTFKEGDQSLLQDFNKDSYQAHSTIAYYPPMDLAKTAKMLVEVSGFRQQLENKIESIGGPVDVAIISKENGFQWYSHKQYYDPAINPHISPIL